VAQCAKDIGAKLLYVSTDYIFDGEKGCYLETDYPNPLQFYGLSKLLGEYEARISGVAKVARMSFKPRPYKHGRVPIEMRFSGGYVDDMAKELKFAIDHYDCLPETINIGIGDVYLIDLARETREVEPMSIDEIPVKIPRDTTLSLTEWHRIRRERG
jgi:dTDP-4-dehydrorhamnose reductase